MQRFEVALKKRSPNEVSQVQRDKGHVFSLIR
jgi:hypothetical protein